MEYTIIKNKKDGSGISVQTIDAEELIESQNADYGNNIIADYRSLFLAMTKPDAWYNYKKMIHVCPVSEYYKNKAGEKMWRCYNGVSVIEICGLTSMVEIQKAKRQVALIPQVQYAFAGADGHSVIALTLATLPDGSLPKTEEQAALFCAQAYALSVQCLQPVLEFQITIKEHKLDSEFLRTVDANPYINSHVVPFIIEQPTSATLKKFADKTVKASPSLHGLLSGEQDIFTYTQVFNAAFHRAMDSISWPGDGNDHSLIERTAEECASVGMPQEEVVAHLKSHFHEHKVEEIRGTVKDTYEQCNGIGRYLPMSKHQMVAFRLREFIKRRYVIRYNEVMQMTEFREHQSLRFLYRELTRRDLNTIHHEALLEGIEATFGEVDELVHSTFTEQYNPIEDYLLNLPKWDGKDHIGMLADTVPTDNPYWKRLFKQWFLSMVAHWLNDDEQHANSTAPILIGAQGYRKSTFCRNLLPPEMQTFYTDSIDFRTNIEAERSLSRFMLVNIDEFDQLSEKQFAFVKHLFQKPATNIRRMYSETIATQRRYASFIGTTNSDEVLRDPTGNRRYLCVYVTDKIKTEQPVNHAQLYAQAMHLINSGVRYWINDEDEQLIRETNTRFEIQSPLEQLFLTAFEIPEDTEAQDGEWLLTTEIMETLSKLPAYNRKTDNNMIKLGKVLTKLKLQKHRKRDGWRYLVIRK